MNSISSDLRHLGCVAIRTGAGNFPALTRDTNVLRLTLTIAAASDRVNSSGTMSFCACLDDAIFASFYC